MRPIPPEKKAWMIEHQKDDRRPLLIGILTTLLFLTYVALGLRILSRKKANAKFGADDIFAFIAGAILTGHSFSLFSAMTMNYGRHFYPWATNLKGLRIASLFAQEFYFIGMPCIKISVLCLYDRIFKRTSYTKLHIATGVLIIAYSIPAIVVPPIQCMPIRTFWVAGVKAHCINYQAAQVTFGTLNIITDWIVLLLPIPLVVGLSLKNKMKYSIVTLFGAGGLVCIVSIFRLLNAGNNIVDNTWDYNTMAILSNLELCTSIVTACLPTYSPLYKTMRHSVSSWSKKSNSSNKINRTSTSTSRISVGTGKEYRRTGGVKMGKSMQLSSHSDEHILVTTNLDIEMAAVQVQDD